jgi:hypothetical protein
LLYYFGHQFINKWSIDATYKFICNQDICDQMIDVIEADEIGSIGDGITWMRNGDKQSFNLEGYRNPFWHFQLDQIYQFKLKLIQQ